MKTYHTYKYLRWKSFVFNDISQEMLPILRVITAYSGPLRRLELLVLLVGIDKCACK
jgi:hypothetical protein